MFQTSCEYFKWIFMILSLINASGRLQHVINIFQEFLDDFVICYICNHV